MSNDRSNKLAAIVPAAGGARRFGALKQLVAYDGQTLIARCLSQLSGLCDDVLIVVGAQRERVIATLPAGIATVYNPLWRSGLASSLSCAIEALPSDCRAALIVMPDQPLVTHRHLAGLIAAWQRQPEHIAAARYDNTCGVPAVLPARLFAAMRELDGDFGARSLIERDDRLLAIDMPVAASDIDTPADLQTLSARNAS